MNTQLKSGSRLFRGTVLFIIAVVAIATTSPRFVQAQQNNTSDTDTTRARYSVKQTSLPIEKESTSSSNVDLNQPSNLRSVIDYDVQTGNYIFRSFIGDMEVGTPFRMNAQEYRNYSLRESMRAYYQTRTSSEFGEQKEDRGLLDLQFNIGKADKIFGPGGVRVRTQGSAELIIGVRNTIVENPSLPERSRNRTYFDFDEKIQLNMNASVGDKVKFNLNYNTDATFDFDAQKIKLQYQGKEDEIIKNIEAGNVSMTTGSSLIRGTQSLFGIKTALQFGKLKMNAVIAQQESQSQTISSQGSVQLTPFELTVDQYEENRHFFLSHFFRQGYDDGMKKLPYVSTGVQINRMEVWITNKRGNYDQSRNIVAMMDLGEKQRIYNTSQWTPTSTNDLPDNDANNLYKRMTNDPILSTFRNMSDATGALNSINLLGGREYDKVENARLLDASEYSYNKQLGYISLRQQLQSDEVLAVAYEYTYGGKTYQVGEFSTDIANGNQTLLLKLIKPTSLSPGTPIWDLMMKNVYSLNTYQVQKEKFRLDIYYRGDSTGIALPYIAEGEIAKQSLIKVMNLDRLDSKNEPRPDGFFDFVEGYTVVAQNGKIYFPVIEPFGSHLRKKINNTLIADRYVFQELYDSTLTVARQTAEKNKFLLKGEYKASSGAEIRLNAMNVPRGSVRVMAGGQEMKENVDYTVDYTMGTVTIINQGIVESGTPISVSLESQTMFNMQRKTLLGLDMSYEFSERFTLGGTVMHLSERPLTQKVTMGEESIKNTIWGLNMQYRSELPWLTTFVNKVPYINASAPSNLTFNAEFAQLIPGHPKELEKQGVSYLDDFEATKIGLDIRSPYSWSLASTPAKLPASLYPDNYPADISYYSKGRSLLSWYYIDGIFTRQNSSLTPTHIKNDKDQLSNHYIREILEQEVFPNKQTASGEASTLPVLNMAFYPKERGPYNVDAENIDANGLLLQPEKRWGGMMRKMDNTDFEASNIEYIEFWMLDPYIYLRQGKAPNGIDAANPMANMEGKLYFNLGEVSEDVLRDGKKSFENGLPTNGDLSQVEETVWGRVPKRQSLVYAFDNSAGARKLQDVGLNGLNSDDEKNFPLYKEYVDKLTERHNRGEISPQTWQEWMDDAFSPINDPGGDNYHYYRGSDYDEQRVSILNRYKRYTGLEGNSASPEDVGERYDVSAKTVPDVEDINQDNTLNEYERYYEYEVPIGQNDFVIGQNPYLQDIREASVRLRNGQTETVKWYQFKIPVSNYNRKEGSINDFKTIRFARMFLSGFEEDIILRFGTLELIRGEWRQYTQQINAANTPISPNVKMELSAVNIEENGAKTPVNYVLPPGVSRMIDPSQPQLLQLNEQALAIRITDLERGDAKAVYKNTAMDLRRYKRLQMFVHAEELARDNLNHTPLENQDLSVFIRLGSDYRDNYYEYEIPLSKTPPGMYTNNNSADRQIVWPKSNMLDMAFDVLTNLKLERNARKRQAGSDVSFVTPFSLPDPNNPSNRATIMGNPSLSDVRTIMIGIRNNSRHVRSAEVWVNEFRLAEFNEEGGWAAQGNLNLTISDIASLNLGGRVETAGFGSVEQSVNQRRLDDYYQYSVATNLEVGRLLPEPVKLKAPLYFAYSEQVLSPNYSPIDQDITLDDALDIASNEQERDSIRAMSQDVVSNKSFSVSNLRFDVRSKNPMPYDPANFTLSYAFSENNKHNPTLERELNRDYKGMFSYNYSPTIKPLRPFNFIKSNDLALFKDLSINWLPNSFAFNTHMQRNYYEIKYRDLSYQDGGESMAIDPSYSKDFLWNRDLSVRWDLTTQIKFNFTSGTRARIEETEGVVDRIFFPDEYNEWKRTVLQSMASFGSPLSYAQSVNASYDVPFSRIKVLSWMNLGGKFTSTYNWDRGAIIDDSSELGNIIVNQNQWNVDGRMNLEQLYNLSPFLKKANERFSSSRQRKPATPPRRPFTQNIQLKSDEAITVRHNLNSKRVKVQALSKKTGEVEVKYAAIDANSISITTLGTDTLTLTVTPAPSKESTTWYSSLQYASRFLMMVRNVSVNYRSAQGLTLPSFRPYVGGAFGQGAYNNMSAPGWDFAFGLNNDTFIERALDRDWLIIDPLLTTPAAYTKAEEFRISANLEPVRGFKIELVANRLFNNNEEVQFMFEGTPRVRSGNLTMTTVALSSALRRPKMEEGFASAAFDQFLNNRGVIASRLRSSYNGVRYPTYGFMEGNALAGSTISPSDDVNVSKNSTDVLIPAFLAAYTGKNATRIDLTAFPSLTSLLPNWRFSYDGLSQIPAVKKIFKSVNFTHAYRCTYGVASFQSFSNWVGTTGDDLGFIRDVLTSNPLPSSMYDINAVQITESFAPLLGVDITMLNNLSARFEYKDTRTLSLNISALQLVENSSREWTVGTGYKIADFDTFLKISSGKQQAFQNDLNLRLDISYRQNEALIRKIEDGFTQPTNGTVSFTLKLSADYALSRAVTIKAFYDRQSNRPLVSSSAYPVTNNNIGISIQLSLNQ